MEQIVHTINGKNYVLIEEIIGDGNGSRIKSKVRKYNGIYQGIKEIKREGFLQRGYMIVKFLIPEEHIIKYNQI